MRRRRRRRKKQLTEYPPPTDTNGRKGSAKKTRERVSYADKAALISECAAAVVESKIPKEMRRNFCWRNMSNDANVIVEVFGCDRLNKSRAAYCPHPDAAIDMDIDGSVVLDIGGHIGVFALYALLNGASHVIGYEPHPENADMYRRNTQNLSVDLREAAVVETNTAAAELVVGKDFQGIHNTWRHSLRQHTHYRGNLSVFNVTAHSLQSILSKNAQAAATGREMQISYVKMDCEGAELDILKNMKEWYGVQKLVFEYSFTKRRNMGEFWKTLEVLRLHFDRIWYNDEGWDNHDEWPWHTDAIVFCQRTTNLDSSANEMPNINVHD